MPSMLEDRDVRWRMRALVRGQLPFLLAVLYLVVALAVAAPHLLGAPWVDVGFGIIIVATIAGVAIPWERLAACWLAVVPILDIVAVGFLRADLIATFGWVGGLALLPILWLAYGFAWYAIFGAVIGAVFITLLPYLLDQAPPGTAQEWFNVLGLPMLSVGIGVVAMLASQRLRRSARATREALQASRDGEILLADVLNTVNAAVVHFDADGRLVAANGHAARIASLAGIDLAAPPYLANAVFDADRVTPVPPEQQIVPRALRGEELDDGISWIGPPGQQMAVVASARRVRRDNGELLGTVFIAYDVTDIAHAAELREQFLETVSHELRTPMTGILGFLDLLEEETPSDADKQREYLAVVRRRSADLMDRVREMLAPNLDATELYQWALEGREIARQSFRSWEAAAEYFRVSSDLLTALLPLAYLESWAGHGRQLAAASPSLSIAYFRASPEVLSRLAPDQLGTWVSQGQRLYQGTWKSSILSAHFFDASSALLGHMALEDLELFADFLETLSRRSHELAEECLATCEAVFATVAREDLRPLLSLIQKTTDTHWQYAKESLQTGAVALTRVEPRHRGRFLKCAEELVSQGGKRHHHFLTDGSWALSRLDPALHGLVLELFDGLRAISFSGGMEFMKSVPAVLARVNREALMRWYLAGARALAENEAAGISYFKLESGRGEALLQALSARVELERVLPILRMYSRALTGEDVQVGVLLVKPRGARFHVLLADVDGHVLPHVEPFEHDPRLDARTTAEFHQAKLAWQLLCDVRHEARRGVLIGLRRVVLLEPHDAREEPAPLVVVEEARGQPLGAGAQAHEDLVGQLFDVVLVLGALTDDHVSPLLAHAASFRHGTESRPGPGRYENALRAPGWVAGTDRCGSRPPGPRLPECRWRRWYHRRRRPRGRGRRANRRS